MLVLARKTKEIVKIGDHITVKVLSIRNGQVKLGIEAPRELKVCRAGGRGEDQSPAEISRNRTGSSSSG
jgi:carbon storage regulator CsrA